MNKNLRLSAVGLTIALTLQACGSDNASTTNNAAEPAKTPQIWPKLDIKVKQDPQVEKRVSDILAGMTVEQKVAQTIQPEIRDISVEDMRQYGFGSYLNGGGSFPNGDKHASVEDWVKLAESMYQASIDDSLDGTSIPTMWGTDAVHGHNNVIGATLFPHNIGLGAAHNPDLIRKVAQATAEEVMATGIDWVFAPTVAVVRDDRWGRTYEGYSEDPEIVKQYAASIVEGLQGEPGKDFLNQYHVISTTKHFLGDGGTEKGDDQGDNLASEQELLDIHAQGYVSGLEAGSQSVMASFNSWHGVKNHGNKYLLTDVLKEQMGFDGFVVGDWNGHGQIPGCSNENCPQALNAGLDVYMVPTQAWKPLYENTVKQVKNGEIPMSRLDDAVSRILRVKVRAGLFDKPSPANRPLAAKAELIGSDKHRAIAKDAVRQSLVLLKNAGQILPLAPQSRILVAGDGADNIGKQSGGWTITWQGTGNQNSDFPGATSIWDGIKKHVEQAGGQAVLSEHGDYQQKPDVAIVVFGENPYAEGNGDLDNLEYQRGNKTDLALLKKLKDAGIPVVSVFISGRPMWVNPELNASNAFVAAWLPGSEGDAVADVLFKTANNEVNYDFSGKLSYSWPASPSQTVNRNDATYNPLLPYGFGLHYGDNEVLAADLNENSNTNASALAPLKLYQLTFQPPWQLRVITNGQMAAMNSNVLNTEQVSIRTTDYHLQEDSLKIQWLDKGQATVTFADNFPKDLRPYQEQNAAISFDIKVNHAADAAVALSMACEGGCQDRFDISDKLNALPLNEWQTMRIDLNCFSGVDFAKIYSPFALTSSGKLDITISNLMLAPNKASDQCQ
ncbi:glycoside hydrolase family 3 protein [Neptunicella marina]|uniref:Glycoside hydrolase family 3 C-terminal domain-containing protein n=1 Tax=Neptunicella marina TaxID=2125989 RepID=A0A8J6IXN7_9ALTE|nr:glycoside hydrolase family 3 N-terminal domain-containing protein [Neptunicella marina]MBC3767163.1 glycoside hydrolase family 3 C-terminal domain-containing protein [Neptunicella marina]